MYNLVMKPPIYKLYCPICNVPLSYINKKGYYCDKCNITYELRETALFYFIHGLIVVKLLKSDCFIFPEIIYEFFIILLYLIFLVILQRYFMKYLIKFKLIKLKKIKS